MLPLLVTGNNPDRSYIAIYRIAVYFWILFGLAFMAAVISVISGMIKEKGESRDNAEFVVT